MAQLRIRDIANHDECLAHRSTLAYPVYKNDTGCGQCGQATAIWGVRTKPGTVSSMWQIRGKPHFHIMIRWGVWWEICSMKCVLKAAAESKRYR